MEDLALLQAPLDTGNHGVEGLIEFYNSSTVEAKNLLGKEVGVILECRYSFILF